MGDDDQRLLSVESVDGIHDGSLGVIVQGRCGLVQDQYLRIIVKSPGNADPLSLPAGQPYAPLPYARVQPLRQRAHKLVQLRFP